MQVLLPLLFFNWVAVTASTGLNLEQLLVTTLGKYTTIQQQQHTSLLIETYAETADTRRSLLDIVNGALHRLDGLVLVQFDVKDRASPANLIFVDNYTSFETFVQRWNRDRYSLDGYYWIVMCQHLEDAARYGMSQRILEELWKLHIVYPVVTIADELEEDAQIYTSWPFTEAHCDGVKSFAVNLTSDNLLDDRLKNFYGCPLRVGAFENYPFIQLDWDREGRISLLGFEGLLINTIAKKLNFTINVVTPPDNDQWGYPRRDDNSTGLMKLIVDESVDLGICSLGYTQDRDAIMIAGVQHYNTYIVFAVPSGRPYSAFEKLFLPFSWNTWCAVFSTLGGAVVAILVINTRSMLVKEFIYGKGIWGPVTNLLNILLGGPLDKAPKGTFARTLVMHWLIFTLVIRTAYQGSLYKYLQVPKNYSAPLTMDAIDKSGLYYYMLDLGAEFFKEYPQVLARTRYLSHEIPLTDLISQIGRDELHGVVLVLVDHIAYHNKFAPKDEYVQATSESIVGFPMAIYYPKRTFLRATLNREVQLIDSSGLVQYWADQYADYDFSHERRTTAGTRALTVDNMIGAFQIWAVMMGAAGVMFAVEVATKRCRVLKRAVDWIEEDHPRLVKRQVLFVRPYKVRRTKRCTNLKTIEDTDLVG